MLPGMGREARRAAKRRRAQRRRRALVVLLAGAAVVVLYIQGRSDRPAIARDVPAPTVSALPSGRSSAVVPQATSPSPVRSASASPSPSPAATPTPDGPPFVLDAAPSCAGATALIDVQVAATAKRPIVKLELLLDGAVASVTPVPGYPLTQYAGRSSGGAAAGGSGTWVLRATDAKGIVEAQPFPYACG